MDKKERARKNGSLTPMICLAVLPEKQKQEGKIFPIPMTPTITGNRWQSETRQPLISTTKKRRTAPHGYAAYRHGEERCGNLQK